MSLCSQANVQFKKFTNNYQHHNPSQILVENTLWFLLGQNGNGLPNRTLGHVREDNILNLTAYVTVSCVAGKNSKPVWTICLWAASNTEINCPVGLFLFSVAL